MSKSVRGNPLPDAADVVVIGGGVAACGLAEDLARRGIVVALLAPGDFGKAEGDASPLLAGSTGLGGRFEIVRAARRRADLAEAFRRWSGLLDPVRVMAPVEDSRLSRATLRLGFALGEVIRPRAGLPRHQRLRPRHVHGVAPFLPGGQTAALTFPDARIRAPFRLAADLAFAASRSGAHVSTYARVGSVELVDGAVAAVRVRRGSRVRRIETQRLVVAGAGCDDVLHLAGANSRVAALRPETYAAFELTGVVPRDVAVELAEGVTPLFAVPRGRLLIAGPVTASDSAGELTDAAEIIEGLERLVPGLGVREEHLRYVFQSAPNRRFELTAYAGAGVRGLWRASSGLVDIPRLGAALVGAAELTARPVQPWPSAPPEPPGAVKLDRITRTHLRQYGTGIGEILQGDLTVICAHSGAVAAEVDYVARRERPHTLADILLRRTGIAWAACRATCCDARVAAIAAAALGWSPDETDRQFAAARAEIDSLLETVTWEPEQGAAVHAA